MKLYQAIVQNAQLLTDPRFRDAAEERQKRIEAALPSGSGFDVGTRIIKADDSVIVFETEFHHMDENGLYDGWTNHMVVVKASLIFGIDIKVSGRNRNEIKSYITETFNNYLVEEFDWVEQGVISPI